MELVIRSDAGGEFTAQAVKHQCQGLRKSIHCGPANQTQSQGSVERMGGCHRMHGKSCLVYRDKCVPAGLNALPQSLTHPIISNPTPFDLLFDRSLCTQIDAVMRVIRIYPCRSLMFVMSVIGVLLCRSLMVVMFVISFFVMPVSDVCHVCSWCL